MTQPSLFDPEPTPTPAPTPRATQPQGTQPAASTAPHEPSPDTKLGQLLAEIRSVIKTGRTTPQLLADRLEWPLWLVQSRLVTMQRAYPGLVVVENDWVKVVKL